VREADRDDAAAGTLRLLIDTHAWLWWRADDRKLGPRARAAIRDAAEVHFSAASAWEIAIKAKLGKLRFPDVHLIPEQLEQHGFRPLAISVEHAVRVAALPAIHSDPFDRILVAQALAEDLVFVTHDAAFERYGIPILDASN